eukprot:CAMPEP_0115852954 /NCGR_PEP_ID=MMETSP0287-20121206/13257_1 /TAXON_ID=412157 /ORGANISM="Chrysochromulina rotalis, Strain UIO044" /LENGTH=147 /DNA_ID=CAMNT_0003307021 /DNA_START=353 /DNA_END=796 /DNA_ORIENTATION=+
MASVASAVCKVQAAAKRRDEDESRQRKIGAARLRWCKCRLLKQPLVHLSLRRGAVDLAPKLGFFRLDVLHDEVLAVADRHAFQCRLRNFEVHLLARPLQLVGLRLWSVAIDFEERSKEIGIVIVSFQCRPSITPTHRLRSLEQPMWS